MLILGWLFGLLSPIIVDEIRRHRQRRAVEAGIQTELSEAKYKLATTVWMIETRFGKFDRELLLWMRPFAAGYDGLHPKENLQKLIDMQLKLSDEQIAAFAALGKREGSGGLSVKRYALPFLESKVGELSGFDVSFERLLMEIRTQLGFLNEDIELARFYFEKTFESLSDVNREIISKSLDNTYRNMSKKARQVANLIEKLLGGGVPANEPHPGGT